jgi:hypothetical protein
MWACTLFALLQVGGQMIEGISLAFHRYVEILPKYTTVGEGMDDPT